MYSSSLLFGQKMHSPVCKFPCKIPKDTPQKSNLVLPSKLKEKKTRIQFSMKMSSQIVASNRENAEIYTDKDICKSKSLELLDKMRLPSGLLPIDNIEEFGYNKETGFVWLKQQKKKEHKFRAIGKNVSYDTVVTAFIEDRKMKKVTGVKSQEFFIWFTISDIYVPESSPEKITFAIGSGLSGSFPFAALEAEEVK